MYKYFESLHLIHFKMHIRDRNQIDFCRLLASLLSYSLHFNVCFKIIVHSIFKDFVIILKKWPSSTISFICKEFLSVARIFFFWQKVSCDRKFLPVKILLYSYSALTLLLLCLYSVPTLFLHCFYLTLIQLLHCSYSSVILVW